MFSKVLIADRGASAMRVARTCERLGVGTVALHGDDDAEAAHVQISDAAAPAAGSNPYADVAAVLEAAKRSGVEAIHPGAGPLAASPAFARAVTEAGLVCVGPPAEALAPFLDRLETRALARRAGLRVAPYSEIAVRDRAATRADAERVGLPLRVVPVLRSDVTAVVVDDVDDLEDAVARASRTAEQAARDGRVYLERDLFRPRHLEVQVCAASPDDVAVLAECECSARLRGLPILTEQPAPALGPVAGSDLARRALGEAARLVVAEARFTGVATLAFLLDADDRLHFVGLDPRLGPKHALTESRMPVDLVEEQLRIAAGEGLSDQVWRAEPVGHAMQALVVLDDRAALDASTAVLDALRWPTFAPGALRVDSAWSAGVRGPEALVAAVTAYHPTRHTALLTLDRALAEVAIAPLATNLAFLRALLGDDSLRAGQYDTSLAPRLEVAGPPPAQPAEPPQASSVEPA